MDAVALRDPFAAFALGTNVAGARSPAIAEVQALRQVDLVGPAEWLDAPTDDGWLGNGELRNGDHLRLPPPPMRDGPAIQAAIVRVLRVDTSTAAASREVVQKEATLRRLLGALQLANREIRHLGNK